jgi:hypothetical protein
VKLCLRIWYQDIFRLKNPRLKTANLHLVPVLGWVKVKLHLQILYTNNVFYRVK